MRFVHICIPRACACARNANACEIQAPFLPSRLPRLASGYIRLVPDHDPVNGTAILTGLISLALALMTFSTAEN